ncbi:MAG: TonB family protein [Bacteroidales bacterium]
MNEQILYLLKVSAGLAIMVIPYYFLFRDDPNLLLKRIYLIAGILVSWSLPLLNIRRPDLMINFTPTVFIDPAAGQIPVIQPIQAPQGTGLTINWAVILLVVYLAGMVMMLIKNLFMIIKWNLIWHRTRTGNGTALTNGDQVFTLFTRIFIPGDLQDDPEMEQVVLHEQAHVRQLHFIDLLLIELTLLVTWFNPFSWLISRMIKENHEYLADRQVLSAGIQPARYRAQLLNHTLGIQVFRLGNQFNHSLTLKRFNMMKKPKRSTAGVLKMSILIPAVLIAMGLTTGMTPQEKSIAGKIIFAATKEPAPGASIIIAGTTVGTVSDINGDFLLKVEGDPEVVVSFVGYENIRIRASKINNKPLELKSTTYTLDPDVITGNRAAMSGDGMTFEGDRIEVDAANQKTKITGSISFRADDGGEANPVFVLDGKVVTQIDDLDPVSIESIEVIKDPESEIAKKYGAKDGVILITTKPDAVINEKAYAGKEIFYVVEDMPSFPGGKAALGEYITSHLEYPQDAREKGIHGEVQVQFTVKASGHVEDIKVIRSVYPGLNEAAVKLIEGMPDWNPGRQRGKAVAVHVVVPVRFKLDS